MRNRRASSGGSVEYFLAGRTYGFVIFLATSIAAIRSFFFFFGSAREWWTNGVGFFTVALLPIVVSPMLFYLFGPRMWILSHRYEHITPGDMLGHRYESTAVRVLVAIVGILFTLPYIQLNLQGAGDLMALFSRGESGKALISPELGSALTAIVVVFYVFTGGGRAIGWSDVIQTFIFYFIILFVGFYVWGFYGGTASIFQEFLDNESLRPALTLPGRKGYALWTTQFFAFVLGFTSLGTWNKIYSARSPKVIRQVATILPILLLISYVPTLMYTFGALTEFHDAGIPRQDYLLYHFLQEHLPQMGGIILLGAFAAGMSTLDVVLLCVSAVATRDIYRGCIRPGASDANTALVGRLVVVATCLVAYLLSLNRGMGLARLGILSFAGTANLMFPLIGALFWKRANKWGVIAGLIGGTTITLMISPLMFGGPNSWIGQMLLNRFHFYDYIYPPFVGLCVNLLLFVGISLLTRPTSKQTLDEFFGVLKRAFP